MYYVRTCELGRSAALNACSCLLKDMLPLNLFYLSYFNSMRAVHMAAYYHKEVLLIYNGELATGH